MGHWLGKLLLLDTGWILEIPVDLYLSCVRIGNIKAVTLKESNHMRTELYTIILQLITAFWPLFMKIALQSQDIFRRWIFLAFTLLPLLLLKFILHWEIKIFTSVYLHRTSNYNCCQNIYRKGKWKIRINWMEQCSDALEINHLGSMLLAHDFWQEYLKMISSKIAEHDLVLISLLKIKSINGVQNYKNCCHWEYSKCLV